MIPGQVSFQITEGKINCTIYINDMVDPQHNQTQEIMRCFISHVAHIQKVFSILLSQMFPGNEQGKRGNRGYQDQLLPSTDGTVLECSSFPGLVSLAARFVLVQEGLIPTQSGQQAESRGAATLSFSKGGRMSMEYHQWLETSDTL